MNIYASTAKHAPGLRGNHENIEVGKFIAEYLDLELEPITKELKKKHVKQASAEAVDSEVSSIETGWEWMGPPGLPTNENGKLIYLDTYHGNFKNRKRESEAIEDCGCGLMH